MLIRTWNVFHGNAHPPEREAFLREMIALVTEDRPDVVCLQELPVWSLSRLGEWSGLTAVGDVAAPPSLGPFPVPAELGRVVTDVHHGVLRSAFTGQANAILLTPNRRVLERRALVLNAGDFRRREARRLGLGVVTRLAWAKERRVCQVLRIGVDGETIVLANLHATGYPDRRLATAELFRAATFVDSFAGRGEPVVLAGDFNQTMRSSTFLQRLATAEWGFDRPDASAIDHILVRGIAATSVVRWPVERRRVGGRILSDHAPVERSVG